MTDCLPLVSAEPTIDADIAEYIIRDVCGKALGNDVENALESYTAGKLAIWASPPRGFLLLQVIEGDGTKSLLIRAIAGRDLYSHAGIESLRRLAKAEGCDTLLAYADRPAVERCLRRLGFVSQIEGGKFKLTKRVI